MRLLTSFSLRRESLRLRVEDAEDTDDFISFTLVVEPKKESPQNVHMVSKKEGHTLA